MKSPFKFLDAFELRDRDVFFGRDEEIDQLYQMVNKNRMVLVYGQSGTGKTSLVQCGLASRYDATDWLPVFVRRGSDLNRSFTDAMDRVLRRQTSAAVSSENVTPEKVEAAYAIYLRPLYLIFDQFEELFILGKAEEQRQFIETMATLHRADLPCRMLLVIREEYLAALYDFEKTIPSLFDRRLRVEPMSAAKAEDVLRQSFGRFNLEVEDPATNFEKIVDKVSDKRSGVSLPYLQIYLDQFWQDDFARTYPDGAPTGGRFPALKFETKEIEAFGEIGAVLGRFLAKQRQELQQRLAETQQIALKGDEINRLLDVFVTEDGTKRPLSIERNGNVFTVLDLPEGAFEDLPAPLITAGLDLLEKSRLLRFTNDSAELVHDTLAKLINNFRSKEQLKINEVRNSLKNALYQFEKYGDFPGQKLLFDVEELLSKLNLKGEQLRFFEESWAELQRKESITKLSLKINKMAVLAMRKIASEYNMAWHLAVEAYRLSIITSSYGNNEVAAMAILHDIVSNRNGEIFQPDDIIAQAPEYQNIVEIDEGFSSKKNYKWTKNSALLKEINASESDIFCTAISPDDNLILTSGSGREVKIWNKKGELMETFPQQADTVWSAEFSPDGQYVLTACGDGLARLFDLKGQLIQEFQKHAGPVMKACFSPDGYHIATAGSDNAVIIWDKNGNPIHKLLHHKEPVLHVVYSSDGAFLLSTSSDKTIGLWSSGGEFLRSLSGHTLDVWCADFSPDGKFVVSASFDKTLKLWDMEGNHLLTFEGHTDFVYSCQFSPAGNVGAFSQNLILSCGADKTIRLWDYHGNPIMTIEGHEMDVWKAIFSRHGDYLLSVSSDMTLKIWENFPVYCDRRWSLPYAQICRAGADIDIPSTLDRFYHKDLREVGDFYYRKNNWETNYTIYQQLYLMDKNDYAVIFRFYESSVFLKKEINVKNLLQGFDIHTLVKIRDHVKSLYSDDLSIKDKANIYYFMCCVGEEIIKQEKTDSNITMLSSDYTGLGNYYLLLNDSASAEKYIKRAIQLDKSNSYIYTKMALCFLLQNKIKEAKRIYKRLKDAESGPDYNRTSYKIIFLSDLANLEKQGIRLDRFDEVRNFLEG